MADLDRRTVKPAHPDATIPDPAHRSKLPPDGLEVTWSPYWARLLRRGDVEVVEPVAADAGATLQGLAITPRPITEADPLKPEPIAPELIAPQPANQPSAPDATAAKT